MDKQEFLKEFAPQETPSLFGPWMDESNFDPPFKKKDLKKMHDEIVIQWDKKKKQFRLVSPAYKFLIEIFGAAGDGWHDWLDYRSSDWFDGVTTFLQEEKKRDV